LAHDLLQADPECILEAHARFVASDHDRALDDRRFHKTPPNGPSFDCIVFFAMAPFPSDPHWPPIDPFWSGFAIMSPARKPGQLTSSFSSGFPRDCDSFGPLANCLAV